MPEKSVRFRVVEGGNRPLPGAGRRCKDAAVLLLCRTCDADVGVATSTWMAAKSGVMERRGRPEGGTSQLVCVHCLARGKVTFAK